MLFIVPQSGSFGISRVSLTPLRFKRILTIVGTKNKNAVAIQRLTILQVDFFRN